MSKDTTAPGGGQLASSQSKMTYRTQLLPGASTARRCVRWATFLSLMLAVGCGKNSASRSSAEVDAGGVKQPRARRALGESSHQQMLAYVSEIRRRTPRENTYLGDELAQRLRATQANMPPQMPANARWGLAYELGKHELR